MKQLKRILAGIGLTLLGIFPQLAYAVDIGTFASGLAEGGFTPPVTDKSLSYLGQLFGTVGNVLHGTSGQLLGTLFGVFNYGIIVVAGGFVGYGIFLTAIKTSQDGSFMGREGKGAWVVIRTAAGLGFLTPVFNGYSSLQVFVMWIVVHGVGFADFAWSTALDYLKNQGGTVFTPPQDVTKKVDEVSQVLNNQVCMYIAEEKARKAHKLAQENYQAQPNNPQYRALLGVPVTGYFPRECQNGNAMCFPSFTGSKRSESGCGTVSFVKGAASGVSPTVDMSIKEYRKAVANQVVLDLAASAKKIALNQVPLPTDLDDQKTAQVLSAVVGAAADYMNIIMPIRSYLTGRASGFLNKYYKQARQEGWIMAGAYYYNLSQINRKVNDAADIKLAITKGPVPKAQADIIKAYTASAKQAAQQINAFNDKDSKPFVSGGGGNRWIQLITPGAVVTSLARAFVKSAYSGNPVMFVHNLGVIMMTGAVVFWMLAVALSFAATIAVSAGACMNPAPYAIQAALAFLVPMLTIITGALFTSGVMMAVYVPMVPFVLFIFGAIGWLIFVVEAMVAAPLVALGVTHPEGHDLLGKAEQSLMLLLSVFLRPILMIIGLLAGMILSFIALRMLNGGFFFLIQNLVKGSGVAGNFVFLFGIVMYVSLVVSIVNVTYGMIYVIPGKVMTWLGLHPDTGNLAQEALQSSKGMVESGAGTYAKQQAQRREGMQSTAKTGKQGKSIKQSFADFKSAKAKKQDGGGGQGGGQGGRDDQGGGQ